MLRCLGCSFIGLVLLAGDSHVQARESEPSPLEADHRPRIGLVLSGGGARGAAHVGVLQVMEQLRIPVDYIAGTSMGSIIGGLYAAGYSPDEMEQALQEIDWEDAFNDAPPRKNISFRRKEDDRESLFGFELGVGRKGISLPAGLIAGQKLSFILRSMTIQVRDVENFEALPIPFRAVAADLETGDAVVLSHGNLADAMRASMSIPGVFTPVELDGRVLVDGGIAANLPIDIGRSMGADRIIAVDVGTPPGELKKEQSILGVASRTISVMSKRNVREQLERLHPTDLLIVPDLTQVSTADFDKVAIAVEQGVQAARLVESDLQSLTVSEQAYQAFLKRQRRTVRGQEPRITVTDVEIVGLERIDPRIVRRRIEIQPGQSIDLDAVRGDMARISRIGEFEHIDFRFEAEGEGSRLIIDAREKSWGPGYLRFGLELESNLNGDGEFALLGNYRRASLNRLGAELQTIVELGDAERLFGEFHQPLGFSGFWFVAPQIEVLRDEEEFFLDTGELGILDASRREVGMDLGVQFRHWGEIRVGVVKGDLNGDEQTGTGVSIDADIGGWVARLRLDQLDNASFPRHGSFAEVQAFFSRDDLDADENYDKLLVSVAQAWSIGKSTVFGKIRFGSDLGSEIPFYDEFRLGGFFNLSGFERNQLQGDVFGLASLGYYWQIAKLPRIVGGGIYAGGALEAGNTWAGLGQAELNDLLAAGAVFLGAETILGPAYLGYGRAESGDDSLYFVLGRVFQ